MAKNMPDATASSTKWAQRMASSGQAMTDGINNVTVSPGQAAAAAKDLWLAQVQAAQGRFATNVAAVPLESWKASAIAKGVPRVAQGAQTAQPKMAAAMQKWFPRIQAARSSLPPRGGIENNVARSAAFARALNSQKGQ